MAAELRKRVLASPAKINLFLQVTGRRPDGYHELETLFQFLEFGDDIEMDFNGGSQDRRLDEHDFSLPEEDLVLKAAALLRKLGGADNRPGVTISLRKRIPPGSGLGGGSSNAATVLLGLNQLWSLNLSTQELARISLRLGADVPVFIHGHTALARGIGEILQPVVLPEQWICLCLPAVSVSTASVFSHPELVRDWAGSTDVLAETNNALEPVTRLLYPAVDEALALLRQYGDARMSGSGSAVYLLAKTERQASRIVSVLPSSHNALVTRTLAQHPLCDRA